MVFKADKFSSTDILEMEKAVIFETFTPFHVRKSLEIFLEIADLERFSMALEIRLPDWVALHLSLPGTNAENNSWINRKSKVVELTGHSTLYEKLNSLETGVDWYVFHNREEKDFAIHGGGFPIKNHAGDLLGILVISGLPDVIDHLVAFEILKRVKAKS